jgi:hypothetical protein
MGVCWESLDCGGSIPGGKSRKMVHRPLEFPGGEGKSAMLLNKTNCLPEGNTL